MSILFKKYIQAVMREACFTELNNQTFLGVIPRFEAVGIGVTEESCRKELQTSLEMGIQACLIKGVLLPVIDGYNPKHIEISNMAELNQYLEDMLLLPLVPERYVPKTQAAKDELDKQRANWRDRVKWLRHLILKEAEPNYCQEPFLLSNHAAARLSAEFLNLVCEARSRLPILHRLGTTARIWFLCEVSDALREYEDSGLKALVESGEAKPNLKGKRAILDENSRSCWLSDVVNREPADYSESALEITDQQIPAEMRSVVLNYAAELARTDHEFREQVFNPYISLAEKTNGLLRLCCMIRRSGRSALR